MAKIPFKVSARAGKLLGRENFSNPEGAIIELVKNSYDADAKNCLVFFDIPTKKIKDSDGKEIDVPIKEKSILYIIDNGEGMTEKVIEDHWMQIGTGNKEKDYISDDKRTKTGAKGIGRFALDRLGFETEMWTLSKNTKNKIGSFWKMDWNQFDESDKSISQIEAELVSEKIEITEKIKTITQNDQSVAKAIGNINFDKGTIIKISNLKDEWFTDEVSLVFKSLEALIPPKELNIPFEVFFKHFQQPKDFGKVETAFFNDYDYKLNASYNAENYMVDFVITRNELDLKLLEKNFSNVFSEQNEPYDLKTIKEKSFKYSKSIDKILRWKLDASNRTLLQEVGSFDLTFYYLKFSNSLKEGYPYKKINTAERRAVLDKFGGVKVYRDSFRVRPYGDPTNDWLQLGRRVAQSPAGAGQRIGDWRVRPEQTAGIITISRKTNPLLVDKSDRGALQENNAFETFKSIIESIIHEFEVDRTKILNPIYKFFKLEQKNKREVEIEARATILANQIIEDKRKIEKDAYGDNLKKDLFIEQIEEDEKKKFEKTISASLKKIVEDQEQNFKEELVQVRALASLGLIVSSFAHELHELKNNSVVIKYLKSIYEEIVPNEAKKSKEYSEGIDYLNIIQNDRNKIIHWIEYSLNSIKKDKRKRKSISFSNYLKTLKHDWRKILEERNILFDISDHTINEKYDFRGFEMDLNTVFGNLINNSIDSFKALNEVREKNIELSVELKDNQIEFIYSDDGIGLSDVFENADDIFLPFTTSKKNRKGENIGTGLGMYLAKNTVDDYNGSIDVLKVEKGFCIKIMLPARNS